MSTQDWILIALEGLVVIGFIALGVRFGGMGLGLWGGVGALVLVFVFGLDPGEPPIDAMLIIVAVIAAAAAMQAAAAAITATQHRVDRRLARIEAEDEDEDRRAHAAPETEPHPADAHAERDEPDHDEALERDQDPILRAHLVVLSRNACSCSTRGVRRRGRIEARDRRDRLHAAGQCGSPARAAPATWSSDPSRVSDSSLRASCAFRGCPASSSPSDICLSASLPCGLSGMPASSMPSTRASAASMARPARRAQDRSAPAASPTAVLRQSGRRRWVSGRPRRSTSARLASPVRAADVLRPLAGCDGVLPVVAVSDRTR